MGGNEFVNCGGAICIYGGWNVRSVREGDGPDMVLLELFVWVQVLRELLQVQEFQPLVQSSDTDSTLQY